MTTDTHVEPLGPSVGRSPARRSRRKREVIYRHTVLVRLCHWVNALCIFLLIGSGLNIFDAHPRLYWGQTGSWDTRPSFLIRAIPGPHGEIGVVQAGRLVVNTTGVLGRFKSHGQWMDRAWPTWITIPGFQDLADSRHWHFFFAWILIGNGLVYLCWSLLSRHIQRDLWPTLRDLQAIPRSIWEHVQNKHPTGEAAKRYNVLQKLAYLGLITLVCGMVATGVTMSPGLDAVAPWLLTLFGGRQSARTIHFICAGGITLFIFVHLSEVVLAGPVNEIRSILTGNYAVPEPHEPATPRPRRSWAPWRGQGGRP